MNDGWNPTMQQGESYEVDQLGRELSKQLHCTVRYGNFNKPMFECWHHVTFAAFVVRGAIMSGNWSDIIKKHDDGLKS